MKRTISVVVLVIAAHLSACQVFNAEGQERANSAEGFDWRIVVHEYVRETKAWDKNEYSLDLTDSNEHEFVVTVVHKDDLSSIVPGAGKSIEVYVDQRRKEVVEELGFQ